MALCSGDWHWASFTTKWQEACSLRHSEAQGARSSGHTGIREAQRSQGEGCGVHPWPFLRRSIKCLFIDKEVGNQRRLHFLETDLPRTFGCVTHSSRKLHRNWCGLQSIVMVILHNPCIQVFHVFRSKSCYEIVSWEMRLLWELWRFWHWRFRKS